MTEHATCSLCGDPMPAGEEMFKFHGYSGPCPKPPLPPKPAPPEPRDELLALVKEASEIMTITYAGNFPAGIESFLVRAARAVENAKGK